MHRVTVSLTGERVIGTSRERLFAALADQAALRRVIPGCQRLFLVDPGRFTCEIMPWASPPSGSLLLHLALHNVDPPHGFSVKGETGEGHPLGSVSGTVHFALAAIDDGTTNIAYHATLAVTGRLAERDERAFAEEARSLMTEFLSRLAVLMRETALAGRPAMALARPPHAVSVDWLQVEPAEGSTGLAIRPVAVPATVPQWPPVSGLPVVVEQGIPADRSEGDADDGRVTGPRRWLFVALGLVIIALLLTDNP